MEPRNSATTATGIPRNDQTGPRRLLETAVDHITRGEFDKVEESIEKAISMAPKSFELKITAALSIVQARLNKQAERGNTHGAETAFTAGMKLSAANKKIYRNYLEFCNKIGNRLGYDQASGRFREHWHTEPPVAWQE